MFFPLSKSTDGKQRVLSLSYGKDSMACLGALEKLQWPLDRIVTADVWATDTIPADLPPMVEFKDYADKVILERYGIEVEHYSATEPCSDNRRTYESRFYASYKHKPNKEAPMWCGFGCNDKYGFPSRRKLWCNSQLKVAAINKSAKAGADIRYLGIAADEPNRFHNLTDTKLSPLVEIGWSEADCRAWCKKNGLLSPIYTQSARGGCWFCHNQGVQQLRLLRKQYPDLWALLLKWDSDSPVTFHADGHTVHDFDRRFALEDSGFLFPYDRFKWDMLLFPQFRFF